MKISKLVILIFILLALLIYSGFIFITKQTKQNPSSKDKTIEDVKYDQIKIGYAPFPSAIFVAYKQGFFEKRRIRVTLELVPSPNALIEALAKGDIDIAQIPISVLDSFENVSPGKFKIIGATIEDIDNPYSFLIVKDGIKSISDLKGKTIVTRQGYNSKVQASSILEKMGLKLTDVNVIQVEIPLLVPTFAKPEVAGFLDLEPAATVILEKKLGKVLDSSLRSKYIVSPYITAALVVSSDDAKNRRDMVRRAKEAIDEGIDYAKNNQQEARSIYQQYLKIDATTAAKMHLPKDQKLIEVDCNAVSNIIDYEFNSGIIKQKPNFNEVYYQE